MEPAGRVAGRGVGALERKRDPRSQIMLSEA
jgi:hypothetical protein